FFSLSASGSCCCEGQKILDNVKEYYGKRLQSSEDLKSSACTTPSKPIPRHIRESLKEVHQEVISRYYGCGLVVPEHLESCSILDLGSGSGRDCYVLSKLVGENGHITGVDMTEEQQLEVARKYIDYHTQKFGYKKPNVRFLYGYIEKLSEVGLKDSSFDIIISNCVVNLSYTSWDFLQGGGVVVSDGGEMYFSDVYANLNLPQELRDHSVLWGECLSGALWWKELLRIAQEVGFSTPRLVTAGPISVNNKDLLEVIGDYKFVSATYRLFKIPPDCPRTKCEVIYSGSIRGFEKQLEFDANCTFQAGEVVEVDEETAAILKNSRFADKFMIRPVGASETAAAPPRGQCCSGQSKSSEKVPMVASGTGKLWKAAGLTVESDNALLTLDSTRETKKRLSRHFKCNNKKKV
uniref:Arsenite methyltransferase n=1 Tax=Latimeria chalumnae TaxID=7897 RepID=H3AAR6_LATCH